MKRFVCVMAASLLVGGSLTAQQSVSRPKRAASHPSTRLRAGVPAGPSVEAQNQLVKQYCAGCHSDRGKAGGLSLASFDAAQIDTHAEIGEKMIRKLRAGMMPPPTARRPDPEAISALVTALETRIDGAAALNPNPG